jgi:type VI secretion system protein ImpJ
MTQLPLSIRWHSGMLVTPASQRHLSKRVDALVQGLPGRYQPFFWGVSGDVEYDMDALKDGTLTVRRLEAVMRNGRHVVVDGQTGFKLPLSLADGHSVVVHVALDEDAEEASRHVLCGSEGGETILGEDGLVIPLSKPRLVLYADRPPQSARPDTSFPLCEVRRESATYRLTDFLPPTLQVASDSALGRLCGRIPQTLRAEAGTVKDPLRLSGIVSALPPFEAMLAGDVHPFALYVELCRVAGAVAVLRSNPVPPPFPAYDHDAAHLAFDRVVGYILNETGEKPSGSFERFTFDRDGSCFRLGPDPGWTHALAPDSGLEVVLTIECDDAKAQWWGENCVIATSSVAEALLARRLLGCARRRITPGAALPSGPNLHHFRITPDADALKPGEDLLVIGNLGGPEPSALYLYVNVTTGTR